MLTVPSKIFCGTYDYLLALYDEQYPDEVDKFEDLLCEMLGVHSPNLPYITGLPFSDRVRADPRFKDLVLRMKLLAEDSATNNP